MHLGQRYVRHRRAALFCSRLLGGFSAWRSRALHLGCLASPSEENFDLFVRHLDVPRRSHIGPFFGWLSAEMLPLYPSTENLKTRVHLRDGGIRPYIELEPTNHPLAVEQRCGISVARVAEIYSHFMHGRPGDRV